MAPDKPVAAIGSRREGRERILGLLYESESKGVPLAELIADLQLPLTGYAAQIAGGVGDELDDLDELIARTSHHWSVKRMPAVDRALLRMATYELRSRPDIPAGAIISEAVEMASEYSTDASSRFVNGVLARLAGELRPDETTTDPEVDSDD
jgi:N utilization substance protein B